MLLPKNNEGRPYISHSQYKLFTAISSFNLNEKGIYEYILAYFFGREWPDEGWAEFGQDVEDYICYRDKKHKFNSTERSILESIEPLGEFQTEGYLDLGDFEVKLVIDDMSPNKKKIRDYKTASKNSARKYYSDQYEQLDLYGLWVKQQTGIFPEMEVCIIERGGNCMFGKGREALYVKGEVWYHTRETNNERLISITDDIRQAAEEISKYYEVFLKMNV